jgi:TonB family protein
VNHQGKGRDRVLLCMLLSFVLGTASLWSLGDSQIGPLAFDPEGADFTSWINHFKNEVYRHWPPEGVRTESRGHVVMEFTVARDGSLKNVRVRKLAGDKDVRRAAQVALQASECPPLPADYRRATVTMRLDFYLHETAPSPPPPLSPR